MIYNNLMLKQMQTLDLILLKFKKIIKKNY